MEMERDGNFYFFIRHFFLQTPPSSHNRLVLFLEKSMLFNIMRLWPFFFSSLYLVINVILRTNKSENAYDKSSSLDINAYNLTYTKNELSTMKFLNKNSI
jgi:hypothetical protein